MRVKQKIYGESYKKLDKSARIISFLIAVALILISGSFMFSNDLRVIASSPKEYNKSIKLNPPSLLNPLGSNLEYVYQEMESRDLDIYTFVKGKYEPVELDYFLRKYTSKDDKVTFRRISETSKAIFLTTQVDGKVMIQLNTLSSSMEPLVFESNTGKLVAIRFSKRFLIDNDIPLSKGHELFEYGYNYDDDPDNLPKQVESFMYLDGDKHNLVLFQGNIDVESENINDLTDKIEKGEIITNTSDIFNTGVVGGSSGSYKSFSGTAPKYEGEIVKDENIIYSDNKPIAVTPLEESLGNKDTGMTLEEALWAQKNKANENSQQDLDNKTPTKPSEDSNELLLKVLPKENSELFAKLLEEHPNDFPKYMTREIAETMSGEDLINFFSLAKVIDMKAIVDDVDQDLLDEMIEWVLMAENGKYLPGILAILFTPEELAALEESMPGLKDPKALAELIAGPPITGTSDFTFDGSFNTNIDSSGSSSSTSSDRNIPGTVEKPDYLKDWAERVDQEQKEYEERNKQINDKTLDELSKVYGIDTGGNNYNTYQKPRSTYRFEWGRLDKSNLNGFTTENGLLLRNVYSYWEVNIVDTGMNRLDVNKFVQVPSEQLLPTPVTFAPIPSGSNVLLKLSLFGLLAVTITLSVFVISRRINMQRNREEFQKNILFKEEKLNLTSFDGGDFRLDL